LGAEPEPETLPMVKGNVPPPEVRALFAKSAALERVEAWLPPTLAQALRDLADRETLMLPVLASALLSEAIQQIDHAHAVRRFADRRDNLIDFDGSSDRREA
jgi:hypothetical protein